MPGIHAVGIQVFHRSHLPFFRCFHQSRTFLIRIHQTKSIFEVTHFTLINHLIRNQHIDHCFGKPCFSLIAEPFNEGRLESDSKHLFHRKRKIFVCLRFFLSGFGLRGFSGFRFIFLSWSFFCGFFFCFFSRFFCHGNSLIGSNI